MRLLCVLFSLTLLALDAPAQKPSEPRGQFYVRLSLTKPQINQAESLQKKYIALAYARLATLRKKYGESPTPVQEKRITQEMVLFRQQLGERGGREFRALLTPAQRKKLDALEAPPTLNPKN